MSRISDDDLYEMTRDLVRTTAERAARRFPTLDVEDFEGVGWVYIYSSRESVIKYLTEVPEGKRYLGYRLRRAMLEWSGREMRAATGIDYRDTFTYTTRVVKELLPDVFVHENWQAAPIRHDGMPKSKQLVNEGGDRMAMLADVSRVLRYLTDDQYNLLVWRYKYNLSFKELGEEIGASDNAARLRTVRAIDRLVFALAKQDPGYDEDSPDFDSLGSRPVMTNAASRVKQALYY